MRTSASIAALLVLLAGCDTAGPAGPVELDPAPVLSGVWAGGEVYDPGTADSDALPDTFAVVGVALTALADGAALSGVGCAEGDIVSRPLSHRSFGVGRWEVTGRARGVDVAFEMGGPRAERPRGEWVRFEGVLDEEARSIVGVASLLRARDDAEGFDVFLRRPLTLRKVADAGYEAGQEQYAADTCERDY